MWLGTSWKMSKTIAEATRWVAAVTERRVPDGLDLFVLPPHTALAAVRDAVPAGHGLQVGAQDAHWGTGPEWTGEVSVAQVRDAGATLVEIGHSERRLGLGEGDDVIARKVRATLAGGLTPLLCVGEPAEVRDRGGQVAFVTGQVRSALDALDEEEVGAVLLAYEPVWAIGAGGRPAAPDDIAPVVHEVRAVLADRVADAPPPVLYGGSVRPEVVEGLLTTGIDGLFVGRAAWDPSGFLALVDLVSVCYGSLTQAPSDTTSTKSPTTARAVWSSMT